MIQRQTVCVNILKPFTGWVLDGLIRDAAVAHNQPLQWNVFARKRSDWIYPKVIISSFFPKTCELAFFAHHETFLKYGCHPAFKDSEKRLYLTHLNENLAFTNDEIALLNCADYFFTQNTKFRDQLISLGMSESKFLLTPGGVDRQLYFPRDLQNDDIYVLISGYFKYRKNPDLIAEVISEMPDINFILHGRFKAEFPLGFFERNHNVKWLDFDMKAQPELMRKASIFLSLSRIEGGPIGILEALASGVPVIATNTGFAREFLNQKNGLLLPNFPSTREVVDAIRKTLVRFQNKPRQDYLEGRHSLQELGKTFFNHH